MQHNFDYTAVAHQLYNQEIPIKVYRRLHDTFDYALQLHSHDFMELAIVIDGVATHSVTLPNKEEHRYKLSKGDFFLINMNERHTFFFEEDEFLCLENILFDPSLLKYAQPNDTDNQLNFVTDYYSSLQLPMKLRFDSAHLPEKDLDTVLHLIDSLRSECNSNSSGRFSKQVLLLLTILSYTQSQLVYQSSLHTHTPKSTSVLRLVSYLQHNFTDDFTLDDLCNIAMCGKRHLTRQFKKLTNETIFDYIARLRINKACILLTNTDSSITDISLEVGYQNSSFFGRKFKEQTGLSPKEYRNNTSSNKNYLADSLDSL